MAILEMSIFPKIDETENHVGLPLSVIMTNVMQRTQSIASMATSLTEEKSALTMLDMNVLH